MLLSSLLNKELVYYTAKNLLEWQNGSLIRKWKKEYPDLIHEHIFNILIARKKLNTYMFGEFYTAIYFAKQGYQFLYEPYIENFLLYRTKDLQLHGLQLRYQEIFREYAGEELFKYITTIIARKINKGQPDLFIYKDTECFFVEVKRKTDKLSIEQQLFIEDINGFPKPIPIKLISLLQTD